MKKYITLCMVIFLSIGAFASGGNESSDQADPVRIFGVVRGDELYTFRFDALDLMRRTFNLRG